MLVVLVVAWGLLNFYHPRGNGPIILMYHHVYPKGTYTEAEEAENGSLLPIENFEEQMKWLAENNYHTMLMSEVEPYLLERRPLPPQTVIITFDDGYESNYVYAFPVLEKYHVRANIAVVVRDSERRNEYLDDSPYDPKSLRHMTFWQLKQMSDSGLVEVGSHSYDGHVKVNTDKKGGTEPFFMSKKYNTVTKERETQEQYEARILTDLQKSKAVLEDKMGKKVNYFAYPYGRCDTTVINAVEKAGFTIATTTNPGSINERSNKMALPRYAVTSQMTLDEFEELVAYDPAE